jgi:hypothetical protein
VNFNWVIDVHFHPVTSVKGSSFRCERRVVAHDLVDRYASGERDTLLNLSFPIDTSALLFNNSVAKCANLNNLTRNRGEHAYIRREITLTDLPGTHC